MIRPWVRRLVRLLLLWWWWLPRRRRVLPEAADTGTTRVKQPMKATTTSMVFIIILDYFIRPAATQGVLSGCMHLKTNLTRSVQRVVYPKALNAYRPRRTTKNGHIKITRRETEMYFFRSLSLRSAPRQPEQIFFDVV